ncbi:hypothetical protein KI387_016646, partial [Taxus chinensis]
SICCALRTLIVVSTIAHYYANYKVSDKLFLRTQSHLVVINALNYKVPQKGGLILCSLEAPLVMDIEFHHFVVQLGPGNYLQWKSGILDHCIMYNLVPHLLGLAPEPIDHIHHQNWLNKNDMAYGLRCLTIPEDLQRRLEFTESAHRAWIFIWNFHGDFDPPSGYGSSDDLASMEE